MFIVVVIIFAVCWLPYQIYFIYTYHNKAIVKKPFIQHVYLGFYWLAMANSMFNPFVYYWMNARFVCFSFVSDATNKTNFPLKVSSSKEGRRNSSV